MAVDKDIEAGWITDDRLRAIEQYLYEDAELLDTWQLHHWLDRFTVDGRYLVPTTDLPDGDPAKDLYIVQDDRFLLEQRVRSLLTRSAHAEYPHSRTRRLISNVRVRPAEGERLAVQANFAIFRTRTNVFDTYVGRYQILLVPGPEQGYLVEERKSILDLNALRPHGKVSIIL